MILQYNSTDDKEIDMLTLKKAVVFGNRSFKPSNAIILTLIPWCPIVVVLLPKNCVIFSMFSGGIISIFL